MLLFMTIYSNNHRTISSSVAIVIVDIVKNMFNTATSTVAKTSQRLKIKTNSILSMVSYLVYKWDKFGIMHKLLSIIESNEI
jgi:hypothetical protein